MVVRTVAPFPGLILIMQALDGTPFVVAVAVSLHVNVISPSFVGFAISAKL